MKTFIVGLGLVLAPVTALAQVGAVADSDNTEADAVEVAQDAETADTPTPSVEPADDAVTYTVAPQTDASPSIYGSTGSYRMFQASGLDVGEFGLSLYAEYFGAQNVVRQGDTNRRFNGHLGFSWTVHEMVEVFASLSARSNVNSFSQPELIQSVGNSALGVKVFGEVSEGLDLGGQLRLLFPAGANTVGLDLGALNAEFLALFTADFRELTDTAVPLRIHFNTGYVLDNSEQLFEDQFLSRVERFGHDVYGYDRFRVALGFDVPVDYVTPFLEYNIDIPLGPPCLDAIEQPCIGDGGLSAFPSYLTIGGKVTPFDRLVGSFGVDIGMTTSESQGTPAIPAWNLVFGLSYNLDPRGAGRVEYVEVPVEVPVEVAGASAMSYVEGMIVDAATQQPISGARIAYTGTAYTDQITSADGTFRTFDFPPGADVVIQITHPEYVSQDFAVVITEEVLSGTIPMQQAFTGARVAGSVTVAQGDMSDVSVVLVGDEIFEAEVDENGGFVIDVDPGDYTVTVSAPGHDSDRSARTLDAGRNELSVELSALRPGSLFRITADAIVFDDATQGVVFDGDELDESSEAPLTQLSRMLTRNNDMQVVVRAHTDDTGEPADEAELTEARAQAVVDFLVEQGVDASRLTAEGAASDEPLFPNISDRNRRRNNRVEFVILNTGN